MPAAWTRQSSRPCDATIGRRGGATPRFIGQVARECHDPALVLARKTLIEREATAPAAARRCAAARPDPPGKQCPTAPCH